MKRFYIELLLLLGLLMRALPAFALDVPPLTGPVVDLANVLSASEKQNLEQTLISSQKLGAQVQVLILPSLEGQAIEDFSMKVAETWKIGTKKKDNGLILLISIQDRALRIEVGGGLEGPIPDLIAHRIIDKMKPFLRQQKYASAIQEGIHQVYAQLGQSVGEAASPDASTVYINFYHVFLAFLAFLFLCKFPRWPRLIVGEGLIAGFAASMFSWMTVLFILLGGALLLLTAGELLHAFLKNRNGSNGGSNGGMGGGMGGGSGSGDGGGWSGGGGDFSGGGSSDNW